MMFKIQFYCIVRKIKEEQLSFNKLAVLLLSFQAELGDYEEDEHTPALISEFHFMPPRLQTEDMELAILEKYKTCR